MYTGPEVVHSLCRLAPRLPTRVKPFESREEGPSVSNLLQYLSKSIVNTWFLATSIPLPTRCSLTDPSPWLLRTSTVCFSRVFHSPGNSPSTFHWEATGRSEGGESFFLPVSTYHRSGRSHWLRGLASDPIRADAKLASTSASEKHCFFSEGNTGGNSDFLQMVWNKRLRVIMEAAIWRTHRGHLMLRGCKGITGRLKETLSLQYDGLNCWIKLCLKTPNLWSLL